MNGSGSRSFFRCVMGPNTIIFFGAYNTCAHVLVNGAPTFSSDPSPPEMLVPPPHPGPPHAALTILPLIASMRWASSVMGPAPSYLLRRQSGERSRGGRGRLGTALTNEQLRLACVDTDNSITLMLKRSNGSIIRVDWTGSCMDGPAGRRGYDVPCTVPTACSLKHRNTTLSARFTFHHFKCPLYLTHCMFILQTNTTIFTSPIYWLIQREVDVSHQMEIYCTFPVHFTLPHSKQQ